MIEYFAIDEAGRVRITGSCQEELLEENAGDFMPYTGAVASLVSLGDYAPDGVLTARPEMPLVVTQNPFTITGIPEGTHAGYPGGEVVVDDGFIEWDSVEPGIYAFQLTNWPYQEETVYAEISDV